jgi:membrane protease YdiL (CAAX protease family)
MESYRPLIALRDFVELILVLAFVVVVPPLLEQFFVARGLSLTGTNRIVATSIIFVVWAGFTALLVAINRESFGNVGLKPQQGVGATIGLGLLVAAAMFAIVVGLETLGYGRDRLGDMASELKGNPVVLAERMAESVFIVGFVEELVFRGFILSRLASIFGGSRIAIALALFGQAALFGLSHGYQQTYGMILTTGLGLLLGAFYLWSGRNLWVVVIGHGVYDAAHAAYIGLIQ